MKHFKLFPLLILMLPLMVVAHEGRQNLLVDADWLKERINSGNLVLFHIGQEEGYKAEHIPGAIYIKSEEYTYEDDSHIFDFPTDTALKALMESKGVSPSSEIVIYTGENWVPLVTRLYLTLDYLGYANNTHILDGGLLTWKAKGLPVNSEIPNLQKTSFPIKPNSTLLADKDFVLKNIKSSKTDIIDCRSTVYYSGIEPTHGARNGRIPGAKTIPYNSLYDKNDAGAYQFKSLPDLQKIFDEQGLSKDHQLVVYCHIGMQMTVVYTAAKLLGYKDVKVYDGSFDEWGKDQSLPIETN